MRRGGGGGGGGQRKRGRGERHRQTEIEKERGMNECSGSITSLAPRTLQGMEVSEVSQPQTTAVFFF